MTSLTFWPLHIQPAGPLSYDRIRERMDEGEVEYAPPSSPETAHIGAWPTCGQSKSAACKHVIGPKGTLKRNGWSRGKVAYLRMACRNCGKTFRADTLPGAKGYATQRIYKRGCH